MAAITKNQKTHRTEHNIPVRGRHKKHALIIRLNSRILRRFIFFSYMYNPFTSEFKGFIPRTKLWFILVKILCIVHIVAQWEMWSMVLLLMTTTNSEFIVINKSESSFQTYLGKLDFQPRLMPTTLIGVAELWYFLWLSQTSGMDTTQVTEYLPLP